MEKHLLKLELRTAVLEEGAEIQEERLEDVVHDLKLLFTHIVTINQWMSSQFGVDLMSKNKYIFAEEVEDEVVAVAGDIDQRSPATASLTPPGTQDQQEESLTVGNNSNNGDRIEGESVLASSVMITEQQEEGSFDSIVEDWLNQIHGPVDVGGAERASEESSYQTSLKVPACQVRLVEIAKPTIEEIAAVTNQYKTEAGQLQQQPGPSPNSELQNNNNNISAEADPEVVQIQRIPIIPRKRFICQYCSRGFTMRHHLTSHMRIHTGEKSFGCLICPQRFSRADYLKAHMKSRHAGVCHSDTSEHEHEPTHQHQLQLGREKSNHCKICGLNFENSDGLKAHLSTSHAHHKLESSSSNSTSTTEPETQYSMPPWRNTSNIGDGGARKNHSTATAATTRRRHLCRYCGRTYYSSNLKEHERIHTGEKPYRCLICQQRFARGQSLKVHMSVHTGEKRHGCHLCSQGFARLTSLDAHLNMDHHGVKPYQCQLCEQEFYSKVVRQQHTRRVHQATNIWRCKICGISCQTSCGLHLHTSGQHYKKKKNEHRDMIGTEEVKMEFHRSSSSRNAISILPH